ncbi:hypothetical protein A7A08_00492 [Methyloligella halotolerans]|uniref:Sulfotransferase family protein n=1 Tax=Methyloligella halotolerans TaxID=1177755 RepID=A0A1E2S2P2_9HYPH|nr:sulfotransferase family protein [Methyloligella halotolerans]ODA68660.1 hypothetical protein A7A08_00492 [Methyloligella halotolerans]
MATKIFGIGLNKTGTTTLAACLTELGYNHQPGGGGIRRRLLEALRAGNLDPIFEVVDQYDSFEDWPYPLLYRELYERYGEDGKFVLTVRKSPDRWLESLKAHSLTTSPTRHCRTLAYGYDFPHGFEEEHLDLYRRHNEEVRAFFQDRQDESKLLQVCWEAGDGWQELCDFLGKPIPNKAFPRTNEGGARLANAASEVRAENSRLIEQQLRDIARQREHGTV